MTATLCPLSVAGASAAGRSGRILNSLPAAFLSAAQAGDTFTCTHEHHDAGDECLSFKGSVFDHIGLKVKDLAASVHFFTAAVEPLGLVAGHADATSASFGPPGAPALWLSPGQPAGTVHIAFTSANRSAVEAFYARGLAAGGNDNGAPGLRPNTAQRISPLF